MLLKLGAPDHDNIAAPATRLAGFDPMQTSALGIMIACSRA
jgi:hypothetical protein